MVSAPDGVALEFTAPFIVGVVIAKINGMISIFGSLYIIYDLLRGADRLEKMSQRIIFALSISDVGSSLINHVIGSWAVPRGQVYGALGNQTTCDIQGYLSHLFALSSLFYNANLSVSYVLCIRYQWSEDQLRKASVIFLLSPIVLCSMLGIPPLVFSGYNYCFGLHHCYISEFPHGCHEENSTVQCQRGANSQIMADLLLFLPIIVGNLVVIFSMFVLYRSVLQRESAGDRYSFSGVRQRVQSNRVAAQGMFYAGACMITYLAVYIYIILKIFGIEAPVWYVIVFAMFLPLQGFFNALVYLRPRFMVYRWENPQQSIRVSINQFIADQLEMSGVFKERTKSASEIRLASGNGSVNAVEDTSFGAFNTDELSDRNPASDIDRKRTNHEQSNSQKSSSDESKESIHEQSSCQTLSSNEAKQSSHDKAINVK